MSSPFICFCVKSNAVLVVSTTCWQCDARPSRRRARKAASGGSARAPQLVVVARRRVPSPRADPEKASRHAWRSILAKRRRQRTKVRSGLPNFSERRRRPRRHGPAGALIASASGRRCVDLPGGSFSVVYCTVQYCTGRNSYRQGVGCYVVSRAPQQNPATARQLEACWKLERCSWECVPSWDTFRKFEFSKFASPARYDVDASPMRDGGQGR